VSDEKYMHSPIVEAVCEFQFEPDSPWDSVMPGLIYGEVKDDFSKRQQAKGFALGFTIAPEEVRQQVQQIDRIQFLSEDEKSLIQVGPQALSVHKLAPYKSWEDFLPLIEKGLTAYRNIVNPKQIHRIGLRYINRIEFESEQVNLEQYFEFRPFIGDKVQEKMPQGYGPFITGVQIPYEDARDVLKLELVNATPETSTKSSAILLDLDYFLIKPREVGFEAVNDWVNNAHDRIEDIFKASISEELKQRFRGEA